MYLKKSQINLAHRLARHCANIHLEKNCLPKQTCADQQTPNIMIHSIQIMLIYFIFSILQPIVHNYTIEPILFAHGIFIIKTKVLEKSTNANMLVYIILHHFKQHLSMYFVVKKVTPSQLDASRYLFVYVYKQTCTCLWTCEGVAVLWWCTWVHTHIYFLIWSDLGWVGSCSARDEARTHIRENRFMLVEN